MTNTNFFKFLFSEGKISAFLLAQHNHETWMDALGTQLEVVNTTKGQILAKGDQIPDAIYFLEQGALKGYFKQGDKEKIQFLWEGPAIVCDIRNFFYESTSELYIETVQDATLVRMDRKTMTQTILDYPESYLCMQSIFLKYISYIEDESMKIFNLNRFERFKGIFSIRPKIELIFSKTDIASLIRISRSSYNTFHNRFFQHA